MDELTDEQKRLSVQGIGKEFIKLLENTNMTKVYKMPVLMAFYNHGDVRMEVIRGRTSGKLERILLYRNELERSGDRDYI